MYNLNIGLIKFIVQNICSDTFWDICATICDVSYYPKTILRQQFMKFTWKEVHKNLASDGSSRIYLLILSSL